MGDNTKRILKKTGKIAYIVLITLVFIIGIMMIMMVFTKANDGVPRIFGVTTLDIQSDSMEGTIDPGDLAVITKVSDFSKLKVGDIITFWDFIEGKKVLNTHKIIKVIDEGAGCSFVTKGTNPDIADDDVQNVLGDSDNVVGKYQFRIPNMGYVIRFLQTFWGFFAVIMLPLIAFFGYRIYVLVRVVMDIKKEEGTKDVDSLREEIELLKAKLNESEEEKNK